MFCRAMQVMIAALLVMGVACSAQERKTPTAVGPTCIWWEGEDAVEHDFGAPTEWATEGNRGILSGDAWLSVRQDQTPAGGLAATWRIDVPEAREYQLWARVGWRGWCGNDWRFDDDEWRASGADDAFEQVVHFARFRPASWMLWGVVRLSAGQHRFQVRFREGERATQGFDCFVLSKGPFIPLGKFRPDEEIEPVFPEPPGPAAGPVAPPAPGPGWWPFRPVYHEGRDRAVDLSSMNSPVGSHGFVTMKDGELYFEDGTPVRFWGANISYWSGRYIFPLHETADMMAEHLARLGVNCVRLHVLHATNSLIDKTRNDTQHFDPVKLDRLEYLAAALRKRGIYVNLDLVFHRTFKEGDGVEPELVGQGKSAEDPGYDYSWAAGGAAFYHPRVIELNRALYRKLLLHRNPYTGMRWADDPQMAMMTVHNEQSIFWGTTNLARGRTREILEGVYTRWLKARHGTHDALAKAWQVEGNASPLAPDENLDTGVIHLRRVGTQSQAHVVKRGLDQLRFLYDVETGFYTDTIKALREWGVKCPIITSNWRGSGETTRLVLKASTLGGVVDRHSYFGRNEPMLQFVGRGIPMTAFAQQAGRAFGISEWNAGGSGSYIPETVPLMATVGALQGWDALFQFCIGSTTWETSLSGVAPGHYLLYPIAAMIFRRGDIRPGELVFERRRDPGSLFSFEKEQRGAPPELIAVGRVQNAYVDEPTEDLLRQDLVDRCWDPDRGVVRAATGEFEWNYKDVWLRLDSERTQGAFGALAGRDIVCRDVRIRTPNEYCAIIVTAMEKMPIAEAERLLVTAVGRERGMAVDRGGAPVPEGGVRSMPPCLMEPVTGEVSVRTTGRRVQAVDAMGYRLGEVPARSAGGMLTFRMEGKPQVVYYEITR